LVRESSIETCNVIILDPFIVNVWF